MKWPIVWELKGIIATAASAEGGDDPGSVLREALELARRRRSASSDTLVEQLDDVIDARIERLLGTPVGTAQDPRHGRLEQFDPAREELAKTFSRIAYGHATPVDAHHEAFMEWAKNKARTQGDDRRAVEYLRSWCRANGVAFTLEAIDRRVASQFMDALPTAAPGRTPVTLNKYLERLSRYWQWLEVRRYVDRNVWERLKLKVTPSSAEDQERPFTDDEVARLLSGTAPQAMHDLMRIAALTGARIEPIVALRVRDCFNGCFSFKPQKKEPGRRLVPIHSALTEIVARRTQGRGPDEDLFPEWPAPKKKGSPRERSFKASNHFTEYRRRVGVDERREGKRRSLVNFHSFRRWFATKAEQAGQPEHIISAVVGHKRKGMTLGRYSAGPGLDLAQRCVEAVQLPPHSPPVVVEKRLSSR